MFDWMIPRTWDDLLKEAGGLALIRETVRRTWAFLANAKNAPRYKRERDELREQIEGMIEDREKAKQWEDSLRDSGRSSPHPPRVTTTTTKHSSQKQKISASNNEKITSERET